MKKPKKKHSDTNHLAKNKRLLEQLAGRNVDWVTPLAHAVSEQSEVVARFLAEALLNVSQSPLTTHSSLNIRFAMTKNIVNMIFPNADIILEKVEESISSLEELLREISENLLHNPELTRELLAPGIQKIALAVAANPRIIVLLAHPEVLRDSFGELGDRVSAALSIFPAISAKAAQSFPNLKESFFKALLELSDDDKNALYDLSELILRAVYTHLVIPKLKELLDTDPRGKVLLPILSGAVQAIPGESCLNAVLSIACTPQPQLSTGRVIAIAVQELGGLYVKISQVIAELCPPSLARELRTSQDDAGGLFPSIQKSWDYVQSFLREERLSSIAKFIILPHRPQSHFASASVGALYEFQLNELGTQQFHSKSLLIKFQRPGLSELLHSQYEHLISLCQKAQKACAEDSTLNSEMSLELSGIALAIERAVINYYKQSTSELDFRFEEKNAQRVRDALQGNNSISIPLYHLSLPTVVVMERMRGIKVTRIVHSKYLERREIADSIIKAYLDLVFEKGVVWADPHPGNILYDDESDTISMVDLNPCFVWESKARNQFKHLLYRLLLRDASGVYSSLYHLVESTEALHSDTIYDDLVKFLNAPFGTGSLTRFVGEFIRTLGENGVDLRIEVQAALRGLSQLALTANAISARNSFGTLLQRHFGFKEMLFAAWEVGLMRVARTLTSIAFDMARNLPPEDVGPVLDERDIYALRRKVRELQRAAVCDIQVRRVSPEDYPNLRMSADGSSLLVTSDLRIDILEKRRPATVRYVVELPTRQWLTERQEFVKLASIARNFSIIECLEQLRRNSLDDYWRIIEAWHKSPFKRTVEETRLCGEVRTAARKLYALRFAGIYGGHFAGLSKSAQRNWKWLIVVETWREATEQRYLTALRRKFDHVLLANLAFDTVYRLRILFIEALLWNLRRRMKSFRYSTHLLPLDKNKFEELVLYGLTRSHSNRSRVF